MQNKKGFTLLEILIALFVFAIISVIMVRALHTVLTAQTATAKSAARMAELQIALLILSNDLEQTVNRPIKNKTEKEEGALIGDTKSIAFTHLGFANPSGHLHRSTLQRTRYYFENNHLIRETWGSLDQTPQTKSNQRDLLNDVTELHFEYLDNHGKFSNKWPPTNQSETKALPCAVRIVLTLAHWGTLTQLYLIPGQSLEKSN